MKKGGSVEELGLPPGFRFHPTDEELVRDYLCRKCAGLPISVPIIADIDLYKFDPWQLPGMALYGEKEWYFFTPRDRKYPNGSRPNRAAGRGYWKATGADKPVGKPKSVGIKKALVFYAGKPPTGFKTNWIMHEYRLANVDRSPAPKNKNLRLDDWVLCRIYNKKGIIEKHYNADQRGEMDFTEFEDRKPQVVTPSVQNGMVYGAMPPSLSPQSVVPSRVMNDYSHFDTSDESVPRVHTDSSGSEQVLSAEFSGDKEVQSAPKWNDLDAGLDYQFNYMNYGFQDDDPFASQMQQYDDPPLPLEEMFMYLHKPF